MQITTIGIDLAKNVFQVDGANERGKTVLRKQLRCEQVMAFFAYLPTCLIGMEAYGSAHHWSRKLQALGHTVRLMAPQFVKPYVKSNKNDAVDAQAICEAVTRLTMRLVPIKIVEQQSILSHCNLPNVGMRTLPSALWQTNSYVLHGLIEQISLALLGLIRGDVVLCEQARVAGRRIGSKRCADTLRSELRVDTGKLGVQAHDLGLQCVTLVGVQLSRLGQFLLQ